MPTPTDTRNDRQKRVYRWRVNLYKPVVLAVGANNRLKDQPKYPSVPTYSAVWCYHNNKSEDNVATPAGRTNYDILYTEDAFKFVYEQEIGDSWLIEILDGDSDDQGQCYVSTSGKQTRGNFGENRRANQTTISARRIPRPSYMPAFVPLEGA